MQFADGEQISLFAFREYRSFLNKVRGMIRKFEAKYCLYLKKMWDATKRAELCREQGFYKKSEDISRKGCSKKLRFMNDFWHHNHDECTFVERMKELRDFCVNLRSIVNRFFKEFEEKFERTVLLEECFVKEKLGKLCEKIRTAFNMLADKKANEYKKIDLATMKQIDIREKLYEILGCKLDDDRKASTSIVSLVNVKEEQKYKRKNLANMYELIGAVGEGVAVYFCGDFLRARLAEKDALIISEPMTHLVLDKDKIGKLISVFSVPGGLQNKMNRAWSQGVCLDQVPLRYKLFALFVISGSLIGSGAPAIRSFMKNMERERGLEQTYIEKSCEEIYGLPFDASRAKQFKNVYRKLALEFKSDTRKRRGDEKAFCDKLGEDLWERYGSGGEYKEEVCIKNAGVLGDEHLVTINQCYELVKK